MSNHDPSRDDGDAQHLRPPPPSTSSLSLRSDVDDTATGFVTASSSRVSHLDAEPLTAMPRMHLESLRSSTPVVSPSPSTASLRTTTDEPAQPTMASLSSVTTFVPTSMTDSDEDDDGDGSFDAPRQTREAREADGESEFVPSYDFDLRDAHERTLASDGDGQDDMSGSADQTLSAREAQEGDVITISHSHSTSFATHPHSRCGSQPDTPAARSFLPSSLSASWPSMTLPPAAVKLHRRRRNVLVRLLKTWEGREQVLHLSHSVVLLLHASLDHPVPRSYRAAMLRPAGAVLAMSFPKPVRLALMQRIYTSAEAIDNFRRVVLIARWITAATEKAMEHWQHRQDRRTAPREEALELQARLTGDELLDRPSDHQDTSSWQPAAQVPFDVLANTNRTESSRRVEVDRGRGGWGAGLVGRVVGVWGRMWRAPVVEAAAESLAMVGEACETAAVLAGGGMFWRAVGIQRLGLPFLSRRRRQGVERLGIMLSLCSVVLSLVALRMQRRTLRARLRSAHRRITRATDKLGWASELAGTSISRSEALSHRKRDPSRTRPHPDLASDASADDGGQLQMLGEDLQAAARDLDDVDSPSSESSLSDTWTVVPDNDDRVPVSHHDETPRRRRERVRELDVESMRKSTERALVRAEADLRTTRRGLRTNFWLRLADCSEATFLAYEAAAPHIDKDAVEACTGLTASLIRLTSLWISLA